MEQTLCGCFDPRLTPPPRFAFGKRGAAGTGLAACLWLWTTVGAAGAVSSEVAPVPSNYRQALASFEQHDYGQSLGLTEHLPEGAGSGERADLLNLRGAVYLRQGRFDEARAAFVEAARIDPKLWAARFNAAEISFRQRRYTASSAEFGALLDQTSRLWHPEEHRFLEYKLRLADLCAGREQPAQSFVDEHRTDPVPPTAWYYLRAALEAKHGQPQRSADSLAQAAAKPSGDNEKPYAESLESLAWMGGNAAMPGRNAVAANRHPGLPGPVESGVAAASASAPFLRPTREGMLGSSSIRSTTPATLAVVQLLPGNGSEGSPKGGVEPRQVRTNRPDASSFRFDHPPGVPTDPSTTGTPPSGPGILPAASGQSASGLFPAGSADVLAKPRRPRGTPTPAPTGTPAPGESPDTQSSAAPTATPAPGDAPAVSAGPSVSPSPDFLQKYEAAYVAFLKKDYPGTLSLLDEADKTQPKQGQSITLRKQVFKQAYETAYLAFRKGEYPGALSQLALADSAQPNNSDALNLRGLVYSKQRDYDQAEAMFKKAVEADPTLWAAKFNYAELPFNRGDYTTARSRYEDLLAETDPLKLPNESELAQYKVFLTLLLEGKTDQARSFMDHFNFSGHTPAKYFCNAAMNFRAGSVDKANGWITSAKREYAPNLVKIFIDSFYRLGWVADPNAAPGTALASASPVPAAPGVEAVAPGITPGPGGTPVGSSAAGAASGNVAVVAPPVLLAASSSPAAGGVPATALDSPAATPPPASSSAAPVPVATPLASSDATPLATASAAATSTPVPTATAATAATEEAGTPASAETAADDKGFTADDALRLVIGAGVLIYGLYVFSRLLTSATRRKSRRARIGGLPAAPVDPAEKTPAPTETPR